MPAVTIRLEMTKQDMRKGRKTGWPVSEQSTDEEGHTGCSVLPGWIVASTIFFALHISGVMAVACPCLYEETSFLAFSRPEEETKRVLGGGGSMISYCGRSVVLITIPTTPCSGEVGPKISSPRIRYLSRLPYASYVAIQVVPRGGEVTVARE